MQLVRNLLEIHGYRQVKFKICKENAGSLNHTTADPEQASAMPQQTQNKPQPHQSRHRARVSMLGGGGGAGHQENMLQTLTLSIQAKMEINKLDQQTTLIQSC